MKITRKNIYLILALSIINTVFIYNNYGMDNKYYNLSEPDLAIKIKIYSKEHILTQPIDIIVSIKNLTNKKILLNNRCVIGVELLFDIIKPSGVKSQPKQLIYLDSPTMDYFTNLDKKKDLKFTVDVTNYYELDEVGEYRVKAIYKPYNGIVKDAWSGIIESNTIRFFVEEK